MPHILIQHEVEDFATWKEAYDSRADIHDAAGPTVRAHGA